MGEFTASVADKLKNFTHEKIIAKTEISGGRWDAKTNTYSVKDNGTQVTTEYKLKKNARLETGLAVDSKSYKDIQNEKTGQNSRTEVKLDSKTNVWRPLTNAEKALRLLPHKPASMGSLTEVKSQETAGSIYNLVVAPAKNKDIPPPPQIIIVPPMAQPMAPPSGTVNIQEPNRLG